MLKTTLYIGLMLLFITNLAQAQKFLLLDNYNMKREKLYRGDKIKFKLKGDKTLYNDYIAALNDSTLTIGTTGQAIPLSEFSKFYFLRESMVFVSKGTMVLASGFLFASAVEPLVSNSEQYYDARESAIIGSSFFVISRIVNMFKWKKYNFKKQNHRIRVIDTTFKNANVLNSKKVSSN